jgi:hypothetical protein
LARAFAFLSRIREEHDGKLVTAYRANGGVPPISRPKS